MTYQIMVKRDDHQKYQKRFTAFSDEKEAIRTAQDIASATWATSVKIICNDAGKKTEMIIK